MQSKKRARSPDSESHLHQSVLVPRFSGDNFAAPIADSINPNPNKRTKASSMKAHTATTTTSAGPGSFPEPVNSIYTPMPHMPNIYQYPPKSQMLATTSSAPFMSYTHPKLSAPTKPKSTLKALPTVRDHTTDQLCSAGDEYIPREIDEAGEKKILPNGELTGNTRKYRCHVFRVPNRGDKLFMLATECARILGYRDSYLLFNKNRSLYKIIANQIEKEDLVHQNIIPFSYRSRQIAIVTARSMFRQFGSRVIVDGRRVRDDYWEAKARKQGFTENDLAGDKRPGAGKAREAAAAQVAAQAAAAQVAHEHQAMMGAHHDMGYGHPHFSGQQPFMQHGMQMPPISGLYDSHIMAPVLHPDLGNDRRDYSGLLKGAPRHEIAGPVYQDQTRPIPVSELATQSQHTADFSRSINSQRDARQAYVNDVWRRPHEQPPSSLNQPPPAVEPAMSNSMATMTGRSTQSPHIGSSGMTASSPMMMTAGPYPHSAPAQAPASATSIRGSSSVLPASQSYSYPPPTTGQMWQQSETPHTPQSGYASYSATPSGSHTTSVNHPSTTSAPVQSGSVSGASHGTPTQSPASRLVSTVLPYPGVNTVAPQSYVSSGCGIYPTDQTPRQYIPPIAQGSSGSAQTWPSQPTPASATAPASQGQWWPGQTP